MNPSRWLRLTALASFVGALAIAGCPPSSDCAVTLDCGPYVGVAGGTGGGGGSGGGGGVPAENGEPCSEPTDCVSQTCVDDVCCDAVCDGSCEACNVSGSEGTCAPEAPGTECPGGACDGARTCATGTAVWNHAIASPTEDRADGVAADGAGAIFLGGRFGANAGDSFELAGGDPVVSAGNFDVFIAKLDARRVHEWSYGFGDSAEQALAAMATDSTGAVVAVGAFDGTLDFFGDVLTALGTTTTDIYVVKIENDGSAGWSEKFGDTVDQSPNAVAVDTSDNVVVVGQFAGNVDFGDGARSAAGTDIFVAKFTSGGAIDWSRDYGDPMFQGATGVATDTADAVIFAGAYYGDVDFGGGALTSSFGSRDAYIAKLDSAGDHVWSHRYGDMYSQGLNAIAAGPDDSVVAVGEMDGALDADGIILESMGGEDAFVMKLAADGSVQWAQRFGDDSPQIAETVAVDSHGNVIVTGRFSGMIDFGGGPLLTGGSFDVFVAKFAADGTHLYSHRYGNMDSQLSHAVAVDDMDAVFLAGHFFGEIDFGLGALTTDDMDGFVVKLSP